MNWKIIFIIGIIIAFAAGAAQGFNDINRWVDPTGAVHYNHPVNDYQVAVEEANDIAPVYEVEIEDNDIGDVQGQTSFDGITGKVISIKIEHQEPAIVYHELFHAQHNFNDPDNTEPNADAYAISRGFYIHDGTY